MSARKTLTAAAVSCLLCLAALLPASAAAAQAPVWKLRGSSQPTNLVPGSSNGVYFLVATNVGSKVTAGEITVKDTLPEGIDVDLSGVGPSVFTLSPGASGPGVFTCATVGRTVTCKGAGTVHPSYWLVIEIPVEVSAAKGSALTNEAEISGGEASTAKALTPTRIEAAPPGFDFLPGAEGFKAPLIEEDGSPATKAGSHPWEQIVDLALPTVAPGGIITSAGHLRDIKIDLPRGMLANPAATPVRCTEAELVAQFPGCPDASEVGTVTIDTFSVAALGAHTSPLYNMVPPPGSPASLGFDALGVGVFPHVLAKLRSDGDYGASGISRDVLALGLNPILDVSTELWGDPAAKAHGFFRGHCSYDPSLKPPCEVPAQPNAFLTLPTECSDNPLRYEAFADSWEEPFPQFKERQASYESGDLEGNPTGIDGCNELEFKPKLSAKPTTNVTESPAGLDVDLEQPQNFSLEGRSTATLKDATVTLPAGLEVNASQADGLAACSPAQVGMLSAVGQSPPRFSDRPSGCPDAARIGTVEVSSPLLGQYDPEGKALQHDPQGNPIPEVLHGSVFIAKPFDNPFNSLLAIYLTVEDPKTGIFAKLAGKVEPDPLTGQLRTRFEENPELPLEHAKIHLFAGPRAPLQTPPTCGSFLSSSEMVPWSAPQTPNATPADSFEITAPAGGGQCPTTAAQLPNAVTFSAGTLDPKAGAFSPLVAKLSRADGSQRMAKLETIFPAGLTGKLAGIAQCSAAQVAQAQARSKPNDGALEIASPSCPASSEIGILDVGAGSGPNPFHISGHLYLAGPYKGAPLSFLAITPAVAGPFDLGSVAVRIAAYLDPVTAQVRALSDPFPQILQGIPVDVRSVAVKVARPNFTLNPTSCEPKSFGGSVTSTLGALAPLSDSFQVAGCNSLPYKPKLHLRLFGPVHRGGHPRFRAVFEAKPGEANTARAALTLPHSEFIDQAHFRTICTRVQFAANQCPAGSIYGHVKAISPLVDYPLEGPIYLRSSNHQLPDVVAALRGPPSQPIAIDLSGRVDSVNGGLRTTIETVPDQPVSKAIITLQGAKKGLFQNSTNICRDTFRANLALRGQNGKALSARPVMKADCPKAAKKHKKGKRRD
ncbi:MAG TPA: hypothetical protein VGC87_07100 [Pyrinomonadaceae bacterium]|jgi:hypothetical protein